jgi:hypothetical protein
LLIGELLVVGVLVHELRAHLFVALEEVALVGDGVFDVLTHRLRRVELWLLREVADREALAICIGFYEITDDNKAGVIADRDATPRLLAVHDDARYIDNELIRGGLAGLIAARNKGDSQRPFAGLVDRECMRLTAKYAD